MLKVNVNTMDVEVPWPNGRGRDIVRVFVAKPDGMDEPMLFGQTAEEAVVNLLNASAKPAR